MQKRPMAGYCRSWNCWMLENKYYYYVPSPQQDRMWHDALKSDPTGDRPPFPNQTVKAFCSERGMTFPEPTTFYSRTGCFFNLLPCSGKNVYKAVERKWQGALLRKKEIRQPTPHFLFFSISQKYPDEERSLFRAKGKKSFIFREKGRFLQEWRRRGEGGLFLSCFSLPTLQWRRFRLQKSFLPFLEPYRKKSHLISSFLRKINFFYLPNTFPLKKQ